MSRISARRQITIPAAALEEAKLEAGDSVSVEVLRDGELLVRRRGSTFEDAFGALTGFYPDGYLAELDRQDHAR